jgi:hypothetical protein
MGKTQMARRRVVARDALSIPRYFRLSLGLWTDVRF